jgi:hypothetical protein
VIRSRVIEAIRGSLAVAKPIVSSERVLAATKAAEYYRSIKYQEGDLTAAYRALYDAASDWPTRPKACYNLTAGVVDTLCSLYHDPVKRSWPDDAAGKAAEKLFSEADGFDAVMAAIDVFTLLTGTVLVRPMVIVEGEGAARARRVVFAVFPSHQVEIVQAAKDPTVADQVSVSWQTGQGDSVQVVRQDWRADGWTETVDDVKSDEGDNTIGELPFAAFRNRSPLWSYFDDPATDLVMANLALNKLMTDLNQVVAYQTAGVLVIKGAEIGYVPKLGPGRYLRIPGNPDASAAFIQPGADIVACIEAINQNLKMFFSARRIPEAAIMAQQAGESGVSLVAQAASLADWRQRRINAFRAAELELIRLTLKVIAVDGHGQRAPEALPTIEYTELSEAFDADDMAEWDWKFRNRVATPIDYMLSSNPGMTREKAVKLYGENKDFFAKDAAAPVFDRAKAQDGKNDDEDVDGAQ